MIPVELPVLSQPVRDFGQELVRWAHPGLLESPGFAERFPLRDFPLIHLDHALAVAAVYAVIVLVGLIKRASAPPASDEGKDKRAWQLKFKDEPILWFQALYNLTQVVLCAGMIAGAAYVAVTEGYTGICNKFDPFAPNMARVLWVFYVSKVLDFFDTFFIVWRGKWAQFSFLHIYHHFSIFLTYWLVANAGYDGDVYYTIVANSFIHLVMYYYYFATSFGAKLSWNVMLTAGQMFQFLTMNAQAIYIVGAGPGGFLGGIGSTCAYPHPLTKYYLVYIISLFALFLNFFLAKYTKNGGKGGSEKKEAKSE